MAVESNENSIEDPRQLAREIWIEDVLLPEVLDEARKKGVSHEVYRHLYPPDLFSFQRPFPRGKRLDRLPEVEKYLQNIK